MNRLMITLFGTFSTLAVFILLILLYRYANEGSTTTYSAEREPRKFSTVTDDGAKGSKWLRDMALKEKPTYSYAVSEMELSLPLKKGVLPKTSFRLTLSNLDDYKMFCIKQLLEREGVDYSVYRRAGKALLVVHDIEKKRLNKISRLVKEYDVETKIEKYIKD